MCTHATSYLTDVIVDTNQTTSFNVRNCDPTDTTYICELHLLDTYIIFRIVQNVSIDIFAVNVNLYHEVLNENILLTRICT